MTGDAELEEGSNAEAIQVAGRLGLQRLMAVVVDNASAALGWPGGIARRFIAEGWSGVEVDGRDHAALASAYAAGEPDRPHVVIARVEGKDA
jgi:transketolase